MPRSSDLVRRVLQAAGRADAASAPLLAAAARVLRPDANHQPTPPSEIAKAARAGRAALEAVLAALVLGDELEGCLASAGVDRPTIDAALNQPFPPNKSIDIEFLDQTTARIQRLESAVRLLSVLVVEILYPADRAAATNAWASSAERRRQDSSPVPGVRKSESSRAQRFRS